MVTPKKGQPVYHNWRNHTIVRVWKDGRYKAVDNQYPSLFFMGRWKKQGAK
jgi:hypothetical protein